MLSHELRGPLSAISYCVADRLKDATVPAELHADFALIDRNARMQSRLIGDLNTPGGDNSQVFSPTTGFPAINVPMGYSRGSTLPVGVTFFGRAFSEELLIKLAYAYEQATKRRRAPASTPPLR